MVKYSHSILLAIFALFSILNFSSCKDDEPLEPEIRTFPKVDQRLWHLFEAFEAEGKARGIDIDLVAEEITGTIKAIPENHVAGQCSYSSSRPGDITVDKEFWTNSNGSFQEFIVFHELGHCFLHRGHREDADESGFCISLMRSGVEDCRDNYNLTNRKRFIDELFFPGDF